MTLRSLCMAQLAALFFALLLAGCTGENKPRSFEEINQERMALDELYMTPSGKRIHGAGNQGVFMDEDSGELAWPVYECTNPDCPGRDAQGQPHLFIWTDPRFYVADDGTLGTREFTKIKQWREAVAAADGHREPTCDRCLELRDLSSESRDQKQKFSEFPRRHVLPETAQRSNELDAEYKARKEYLEKRMEWE